MSFVELWNRPPSVNYPFIWIQIHLKDNGEGEGTMSTVAKLISAGGRHLVVENYELMEPVRLSSLKAEQLKR